MASNSMLQTAPDRGWLQGFGNLARKENGAWWGTRTWLWRTLIWVAIINGMVAMVLWSGPASATSEMGGQVASAIMIYLVFSGLAPAIGVIIIGQDAIIHEKQMGTAAWMLSKPITRQAFILAKLAANTLGVLVTMVLVPGILAYAEISLAAGTALPALPWLGGMALIYLDLSFYLALTLMLGTQLNARGGVIGIPMAILLGYQLFMGAAPWLANYMPWGLVIPMGQTPSVAALVIQGQPIPTIMPIICTALWILLFVGVSIWRFNREEF